jgi:hypothetical protein
MTRLVFGPFRGKEHKRVCDLKAIILFKGLTELLKMVRAVVSLFLFELFLSHCLTMVGPFDLQAPKAPKAPKAAPKAPKAAGEAPGPFKGLSKDELDLYRRFKSSFATLCVRAHRRRLRENALRMQHFRDMRALQEAQKEHSK